MSKSEVRIDVRPWGAYQIIDDAPNFKVKRITVNPGKRLSLQRHKQRAEHWYIVQGVGMATVGDKQFTVEPGQFVDVPKNAVHRIENTSDIIELIFIEVQTGSYFGEDDIERLEDDFGRV